MPTVNLIGGWLGILAGVMFGAVIGLFFHDENWLGGYASFPRRLVRLAHVAFFGLGFLNLAFAATARDLALPDADYRIASWALIAGAIAMPACCLAAAWRKPLRHLFPIPVACVLAGLLAILIGWWTR